MGCLCVRGECVTPTLRSAMSSNLIQSFNNEIDSYRPRVATPHADFGAALGDGIIGQLSVVPVDQYSFLRSTH
jgi:hypothetical protein